MKVKMLRLIVTQIAEKSIYIKDVVQIITLSEI